LSYAAAFSILGPVPNDVNGDSRL